MDLVKQECSGRTFHVQYQVQIKGQVSCLLPPATLFGQHKFDRGWCHRKRLQINSVLLLFAVCSPQLTHLIACWLNVLCHFPSICWVFLRCLLLSPSPLSKLLSCF